MSTQLKEKEEIENVSRGKSLLFVVAILLTGKWQVNVSGKSNPSDTTVVGCGSWVVPVLNLLCVL